MPRAGASSSTAPSAATTPAASPTSVPSPSSFESMRRGRNPTKTTDLGSHAVEVPPPISVALLTHVPYLAGFHADQLDVIRLAVLSARAHAGRPIHLVVVDNGSCPEVVDWLNAAVEQGHLDQLVRNRRNL